MKIYIKHFILFLCNWHKNRHTVKFPFSSHLSLRCVFEGMNTIGEHTVDGNRDVYRFRLPC